MKRLLLSLMGLLLLPMASLSAASPTSFPPALHPIYVPTATSGTYVPCGGGANITSLYYFPTQGEDTYALHALVVGGAAGGDVILSLPLGYEESAYVPPMSGQQPYTVTVTTPPYTGNAPMLIQVRADGGACNAAQSDSPYMVVRAVNIKAGSSAK